MADIDYKKLAEELKKINADLGLSKQIVQIANDGGDAGKRLDDALSAIDALTKTLITRLSKTAITEEEKNRKVAELEMQVAAMEVAQASEPDFDTRIRQGHEIARLSSVLADMEADDVFTFDKLLDPDKLQLKDLLTQAAKDLQAKHNLARVLAGIQIIMQVAAYSAGVAAKLAVAAAA